ncbi:HIT family protein [Candidatus Stoquefichus massiliensis]|uniref:HIT family protein n=1 Tax=Candidatus Stoquefichus massiliensis TaxID=1470350 RepID=UPI00048799E7|nr:HIT domain-containing protein [Candidatus Stoquefichus massiliensis]
MDSCIFCEIGKHHIPGKVIYEDEMCMAFLDLSQTTDGHTLVIPKKHFHDILEVDEKTLSHMMNVVQKVAHQLQTKLDAQGFNIMTNMNEIAGQSVHHFHIHIIPRFSQQDGFNAIYTDRSKEIDLEAIYHRIMD